MPSLKLVDADHDVHEHAADAANVAAPEHPVERLERLQDDVLSRLDTLNQDILALLEATSQSRAVDQS